MPVDSRGSLGVRTKDEVLYQLYFLCKLAQVPFKAVDQGLKVDFAEYMPVSDRNLPEPLCFAFLELDECQAIPEGSLLISSKLDFDVHTPNCRIAFFGKMLTYLNFETGAHAPGVRKW